MYVGRPNLGNRERLLARITDILDRRWFTNNGEYVQEFERRIADFLEVEHCIAMCNGTVALEIAIRAAGLTGEVLVPSFTFIATAHALQWQQITPSFCDVDLDTHTLDATRLERMITPRTTGIVAVHLWGRPCDVDALSDVARRHNLVLLFDAAHALGCSYKGRMIGGFGDAEILSFHATKFFNTFEGGAVVTNNGDLAAKMRLMRNFGFSGYDTVIHVGTNGKMTEIAAAMGLTSLESYEEFVAVNYQNYKHYQNGLDGIPGVSLVRYDETERCNYQYIVVQLDETAAGISRDAVMSLLNSHNVMARRYFYPGCHQDGALPVLLSARGTTSPADRSPMSGSHNTADRPGCFGTRDRGDMSAGASGGHVPGWLSPVTSHAPPRRPGDPESLGAGALRTHGVEQSARQTAIAPRSHDDSDRPRVIGEGRLL